MARFTRVLAAVALSGASVGARVPAPAGGVVLRVDDDAPAGGDGLSWATAFRDLQDALAAAGGGPASIRVAQGLQRPDQAEGGQVVPGDRGASFVLGAGIGLLGGYAGLGAPDPDARDVAAFVSRLEGDLLGDDGPGFAGHAENSWHVVTVANAGGFSLLDGFRITGGVAEPAPGEVGGAGVLVSEGSGSVLVSRCALVGNFSSGCGAGLATDGAAISLVDTRLEDNHASASGGGLFGRDADVALSGRTFTGNQADSLLVPQGGGGAAVEGGTLGATDCAWSGNSSYRGGALDVVGGTLQLHGGAFVANESISEGGAVMSHEGAGAELRDVEFSANQAGLSGGGAQLRLAPEAALLVRGCRFSDNVAGGSGGLGVVSGASAAVLDSVFEGNTADTGAGLALGVQGQAVVSGCRIVGNTASGFGGGLVDASDEVVLLNCVIAGNHAGDDAGGVQL